jgi:hypothetical protein
LLRQDGFGGLGILGANPLTSLLALGIPARPKKAVHGVRPFQDAAGNSNKNSAGVRLRIYARQGSESEAWPGSEERNRLAYGFDMHGRSKHAEACNLSKRG